jgi:hypothetical protein
VGPTGKKCRMDHLKAERIPDDVADSPKEPSKLVREDESSDSESDDEVDVRSQLKDLSSKFDWLTTAVQKLVQRDLDAVEKSSKPISEKIGKAKKKAAKVASLDPKPVASGVTTSSLAKDKELNTLLRSYNEGERDFLAGFNKVASASAGEKPKKALYIPDFVTCVSEATVSDDEEILTTSSGTQLSLKTKPKRLEPKDVTLPMWISANSRICDVLSPGFSSIELQQYNEFTRQIGDLLQLYSVSSVMVLDHEHRRHVAATGRAWDDISHHLEKIHLRSASLVTASPVSVAVKSKKKSSHVCRAFNTRQGCKNGDDCTYRHVCSEKNCTGKHPKHEHDKFQKTAV